MAAHDPYQSLRYAEYRWFLVGTMALFTATQIQSTVMGWQVYAITHDVLSLGFIGLAEAIPFLSLTLLGGWLADHGERKRIGLAALLLLLFGAGVMLCLAFEPELAVVWPFYAVQALAGVGRAFHRPALWALSAEIVPREAYENASTWRASTFQLALMAGPAAGGLLYGLGGPALAYGVELALMLVGFGCIAVLRRRPPAVREPSRIGAGLLEGVRFVLGNQIVLAALSLDLFAVLFGGAVALLPAFAEDVLHVGPRELGLLRAAPAAGSVVMALVLAHRPPFARAGRALLTSVGAFGLCWIAFALSRSFALSLLLLVAAGAFDNVSVVLRGALVQTQTPPRMMGRVQAVNSFFIGSSNELGAFESGVAARLLGLVPSVVLGGLMTLGVVAVTARVRALRTLGRI